MRKANLFLLSAAPLTVFAAAALAQQVMYSGQKPSPAVPYGQQGQQEQAMTYEQALAQQQAWQSGHNGQGSGAGSGIVPNSLSSNSGEAAPVAVDPDGNPIFGAVGSSDTQPETQPRAGNGSRNEAQLEADRLRQDPAAAEQSQQAAPQADAGSYGNQQAYAQPYQQPSQQQVAPPQQAYGQGAYQQPQYQQPQYQTPQYQQPGYSQQGYAPQQGYAEPQQADNGPDQAYGYAPPPAVAPSPYGVYPAPVAPPVVAFGYPYAYPYGYRFGVRIGGPYVGGYYRGGYGFRGGYAVRGFVGGPRGGVYFRGGRR